MFPYFVAYRKMHCGKFVPLSVLPIYMYIIIVPLFKCYVMCMYRAGYGILSVERASDYWRDMMI